MSDDDFEVRPGRVRDRGRPRAKGKVARSAQPQSTLQAGRLRHISARIGQRRHRSIGRGRGSRWRCPIAPTQRRVIIKARSSGTKARTFTAAPLARHLTYLKRDGVTATGRRPPCSMQDPRQGRWRSFAERCADDRHHFRFIVSPEDAAEMEDVCAPSPAN
jgi:hypothetical protein